MSTTEQDLSCNPALPTNPISSVDASRIKLNDYIILQLPSGELRSFIIKEPTGSLQLGKFGSFIQGQLLGHPFGHSYEILPGNEGKIRVQMPEGMRELEDTSATNELINDGDFVQPLTFEEIEALKNTPGVHSSEIIRAQIEKNSNYSLKTEYSKDKYKKRKEAKYFQGFKVVQPTMFNICDYWFNRDPQRVKNIRPDTLSQMMTHVGAQPGGRYIVVDDAGGLLLAALLDRLGGKGRVLTITDSESPPTFPVVNLLNIPTKLYEEMVVSLNWAQVDANYTPVEPSADPPEGGPYRSDKQRIRLEKRRATSQALQALRQEYFDGEWNGLLVASDYDPFTVIEKVFPYLAGSSSIVVHSPYLQVLVDAYQKMKKEPKYLGPSLTESWLRQYQVLPGRTHPVMNASGSGGYVLNAIKVFDDSDANSIVAAKYELRRRKKEAARRVASSLDVDPKTEVHNHQSGEADRDSEDITGDIVRSQ
ncbi:tRNA (adenine(58)-N(1))-methyltransferase non-catalytic subunit trm6 [Tulasnella sp. 418]|nr:tRNA (adenine(58)-N(1))-methyltransferase non-catalytic subunit trm6 [Tulasnella sp. 418]